MPLISITNLTTGPVIVQDPSGLSNLTVTVPESSTKSGIRVTDDTLARVQPSLDASVAAGRISYAVLEDPTALEEHERLNVRTGTVSPITATKFDECIIVNLAVAGASSVVLPTALPVGSVLDIVDGKGDAAAHNITIDPEGAGTINGAASLVLSVNYASARLVKIASTAWLRLPG
jgi:hypothetical protein